jgi:streptogramin lyase
MKKIEMTAAAVSLLLLAGCGAGSDVAPLTGKVNDSQGAPLAGVMVRVSDEKSGLADSTFTNGKGEYRLPTKLAGALKLRFRLPYYTDIAQSLTLDAARPQVRSTVMAKMTSDSVISDSLPSAYHFDKLRFDAAPDAMFSRANFQRDCAGCHALGGVVTGNKRSLAEWTAVVALMQGNLSNPDPALIAARAERITAGFDGAPVTARPVFPVGAELGDAVIHEFKLPDIAFPHDADLSRDDGLLYTVDRFGNQMVITNLSDGKSVTVAQPPSKRPAVAGNSYAARSVQPGPHSLAQGKTGLWYTTNSTSDEIGVFDPKTRTWKDSFVLPEPARYPHTIRIASDGFIWFTLAGSQQVGRLDPVSGAIKLISLPPAKALGGSGGASVYGIDVSPADGRIWYARLWGDRIGVIDPKTLVATEFASPVKGPRRLRFDASGALWLTGYSEGMIARIDTKTMQSDVYPMPEFAPGARPAPYALAVHPQTQEIWINETSTDRVYRFLPKEKRFVVYPMPLHGSFTRDFTFTKQGWACTTNSPILNAGLEGGVTGVICFDINGAKVRS